MFVTCEDELSGRDALADGLEAVVEFFRLRDEPEPSEHGVHGSYELR